MLNKLKIKLEYEGENKLNYKMASLMQGVLMEHLESQYIEQLHQDGLHPYQQYLSMEKEQYFWNIHTLTKEAEENIFQKMININEFYIKKKEISLKVIQRETVQISYQKLLESYYFDDGNRYLILRFHTATSFKSKGKYIFYPSIKHIFQSIMNKHNEFNVKTEIRGESLLEELEQYVEIIQYKLQSNFFYLEGIKIPSFIGTIKIKINGPQPIVNLVNFLLAYAEFSGVGIKCGMGMGACQVEWNK